VADAVAAKRRRRGRKAEAAPAEVVPAADIDGNGYEIPANPIPDPLGADLGLGLYPRARARVQFYTRRIIYNGFQNVIPELENPQTR
jgi:hypothetical protein